MNPRSRPAPGRGWTPVGGMSEQPIHDSPSSRMLLSPSLSEINKSVCFLQRREGTVGPGAPGARRRLPASPQECLALQRTRRVDVDAGGRKCREKMARVLWEAWAPPGRARLLAFEVKELSSPEELRAELEAAGLPELLPELVPELVLGPAK